MVTFRTRSARAFAVQEFLESGSYLAFLLALVGGGLGVPIPEDLVLLTAGALSKRGITRWWIAAPICYVGVLLGDSALYLAARKLGNAALETRRFRKLLPPHRRARLERLFERRGALVIFVGRHIPGVRAPTFALAGIHRYPYGKFLLWDALALCISGPLVFLLGYLFAGQLSQVKAKLSEVKHILFVAAVVIFAIWASISFWRSRRYGNPAADRK